MPLVPGEFDNFNIPLKQDISLGIGKILAICIFIGAAESGYINARCETALSFVNGNGCTLDLERLRVKVLIDVM